MNRMAAGDRITVTVHTTGPTGTAVFEWVVTRIVDTLRESPVPITVRIKHNND